MQSMARMQETFTGLLATRQLLSLPCALMSLFSACPHGAGSGFLTCKCPVCTITPDRDWDFFPL